MNLNTFGDYPALIQKFIDFWGLLNAARVADGGTPLVMDDGFDLAALVVSQDALAAAIGAVDSKDEARGLAAADRDTARTVAYDAMDSWRKRVASKLRRTKYEQGLPILPSKGDGVAAFLKPFSAVNDRWSSINAATNVPNFTPPLVLNDGTTLAQFNALVADVSATTSAVSLIEEEAGLLRATRDELLPPLKRHFEDIRAAVIDQYPADSVWVKTLPKLSERSTSTPAGVTVKVVFDSAAGGWKLSWKTPSELDVERYSVRIAAGPRYKAEGERSIGDLTPDVVEFLILESLVPSGATVWAKVFVINETGNEKGSNAVRLAQ